MTTSQYMFCTWWGTSLKCIHSKSIVITLWRKEPIRYYMCHVIRLSQLSVVSTCILCCPTQRNAICVKEQLACSSEKRIINKKWKVGLKLFYERPLTKKQFVFQQNQIVPVLIFVFFWKMTKSHHMLFFAVKTKMKKGIVIFSSV